jgi:hypothetical protein
MSNQPPAHIAEYVSPGVAEVCEAYGMAHTLRGACPYCTGPHNAVFHGGFCPRVRAIEYHENGTVRRVEFHPAPAQIDGSGAES